MSKDPMDVRTLDIQTWVSKEAIQAEAQPVQRPQGRTYLLQSETARLAGQAGPLMRGL